MNVWIGQVVNEKWDWDFNYFNANLNIEDNNSARFHSTGYSDTLKGFGLNADRVFNRSSGFSPFITMGVGYIDDGRDPGYDELFVKLGIGALIDLAHFSSGGVLQLKASADGRYQFADVLDAVVWPWPAILVRRTCSGGCCGSTAAAPAAACCSGSPAPAAGPGHGWRWRS